MDAVKEAGVRSKSYTCFPANYFVMILFTEAGTLGKISGGIAKPHVRGPSHLHRDSSKWPPGYSALSCSPGSGLVTFGGLLESCINL